MGFQLVPTSVTLNGIILPDLIALEADCITVVDNVPFWPKLTHAAVTWSLCDS